jgi:SRSO17 transposase
MRETTQWAAALEALFRRMRPHFKTEQSFNRAKAYLQGLLSSTERKNTWQLAELLGDKTPYALQQFLYRSVWDAEALRDTLREVVVESLGEKDAVLVVDETGFIKKGTHSAGVQRQYSGTAGRIENCQIGVFLCYASSKGHAFLDRALYLPQSWTNDRERCEKAGIPQETPFMTKPYLAGTILSRSLSAGVPFGWVTGDCVYGDYRPLRLWLESIPKGYVLAVSGKEYVNIAFGQHRVSRLLEDVPQAGWRRLSAGQGSKGQRLYDWFRLPLMDPLTEGWERSLLIRRSLSAPEELAAYVCFAPKETALQKLVAVAGSRWTIESAFEEAKGEVGLDQYEVRGFEEWYRHVTLALLAHAFLAGLRAKAPEAIPGAKKRGPARKGSLRAFKKSRGLAFA